jgi:hypothetical protein
VIGKDAKLWRWHVDNVLRNAELPRDMWDFHVILFRNEKVAPQVTAEIVSICEENDITYHMLDETIRTPFLHRLYKAWNLVQTVGDRPFTLRSGSDQAWYKGSFRAIWEAYEALPIKPCVLQAQTVESAVAEGTRHFKRDFGSWPEDFDEPAFNSFCEEIIRHRLFTIEEAMEEWGHPTTFSSSIRTPHNRTDGCSWYQSKELFNKFGPMPPLEGRWTGDVIIHDRYQRAGIQDYLVGNCITYHLFRGERRLGEYNDSDMKKVR